MKHWLFAGLAVVTAIDAQAAVVYSTGFETDQSSAFTVTNHAGDFVANFNYDYALWVPTGGTPGPASIPAAPSGAGTKALRLEANHNDATGAEDAVTAYVNAASTGTQYTLKFDLWMQYGTGNTTEFVTFGGHSDAGGVATAAATAFKGFFVTMTGDGGAGQDYRYYYSTTPAVPTRSDAVPDWNGANELDNGAAGWQAVFPTPTYTLAGAPSMAWTVVELVVNGTSVQIYVTPTSGSRTLVSSFGTDAALTQGYPFVGYAEIFTSLFTQDQFALIDNLSVTVPDPVAAATDWSIYE